jgi:transposase InsO family protein
VADRVPVIALGQRLAFQEQTWTVVALAGAGATLQGPSGQVTAVLVTHLVSADGFAVLDEPGTVPVRADSLLEGLDPVERDRVRRLEAHLLELDQWIRAGGTSPTDDRLDRSTTVDRWIAVKAEELAGTDLAVGVRQLYRLRAAYQADGAIGLVERRVRERLTGRDPLAAADDRVLTALGNAMTAQSTGSTISRKAMFVQVRSALAAEHGDALRIPSERELYRLAALLDRGRHTFGAATTRRTHDNRPGRPFSSSVLVRPGEQVQIDTNTIDILCRYADGVTRRAELTIAVDVATRSILTAVIAPSTKAVDAVAVLARLLVPQPLRPGWPETLLMAHSALPFDRLVSIDARFELAQALPVILPDTLVCDRGSVYMADAFRRACRHLGISVQPARPYTPTDKPAVERTFGSINTLFCQHIHGYVGSGVAMRGKDPAAEAVFTVAQLQDLFDEWVVAVWQNRPHESLTTVWGENRPMSPNEAYAVMVACSGYVPIPRSAADYVELLPAEWRQINEEGVTFNNRVYDSAELNPYRRADSGITEQNGRWELHHDPYDVTQIWVRNHHAGGWVTAAWVHRDLVRQPFSAAIYEHVRARSAAAGEPVRDDYIARRVAEMLDNPDRTGQSPADKRMVAREANNPPRRTAPSGLSEEAGVAAVDDGGTESDGEEVDTNLEVVTAGRNSTGRGVVGFGVFDPTSTDWGFR